MALSVQRALEDLRVVSAVLKQESVSCLTTGCDLFVLARLGSASDSATTAPPTS